MSIFIRDSTADAIFDFFNLQNRDPLFLSGSILEQDTSDIGNALTNADFIETPLTPDGNFLQLPFKLVGGWNLVGYPGIIAMDPFDFFSIAFDVPISDFADLSLYNLIIMKNNLGQQLLPEFNFNGIGDFIPGQGYQVKMPGTFVDTYLDTNPNLVSFYNKILRDEINKPSEKLELQQKISEAGLNIDQITNLNQYQTLLNNIKIDINAGFNMIGYTQFAEVDAVEGFSQLLGVTEETLEDELIIAKNNLGQVLMPDAGFNGVGNLIPGQGYHFKTVNSSPNRSFPEASDKDLRPLIDGGPR